MPARSYVLVHGLAAHALPNDTWQSTPTVDARVDYLAMGARALPSLASSVPGIARRAIPQINYHRKAGG